MDECHFKGLASDQNLPGEYNMVCRIRFLNLMTMSNIKSSPRIHPCSFNNLWCFFHSICVHGHVTILFSRTPKPECCSLAVLLTTKRVQYDQQLNSRSCSWASSLPNEVFNKACTLVSWYQIGYIIGVLLTRRWVNLLKMEMTVDHRQFINSWLWWNIRCTGLSTTPIWTVTIRLWNISELSR